MNDLITPVDPRELQARAEADAQAAAGRGEDLVARAAQLTDSMTRQIAEIRADQRLSDDAKAADVARLTAETNANRKALGAAHEAGLAAELDTLRRRLCSPPGVATGAERIARDASFRDAMQRAHATEARNGPVHPLMDVIHGARLTGDDLQERAAMVVALERGDADVLDAWLQAHPEDGEVLNQAYGAHFEVTDRKRKFARAMHFHKI